MLSLEQELFGNTKISVQKKVQTGRKAQQAAAERSQKAQWAEEERKDTAERARMEAELAKGKKDDSIKTPQSKFEDTEDKIEKNKSDLSSFKRTTRRNINDHGRDITTLQKDVESIQEKIGKLKESAFKKED